MSFYYKGTRLSIYKKIQFQEKYPTSPRNQLRHAKIHYGKVVMI